MTPLENVEALLATSGSPAEYRTVMSRAYYASFRTLCAVTGPLGFDQNEMPRPGERHRSVHMRLFRFLRGRGELPLRRIGASRIEPLYRLRIRADYRFDLPVTKPHAEDAVLIAQEIHDWIDEPGITRAF